MVPSSLLSLRSITSLPFIYLQIRDACKDLILSDDQLKMVMKKFTEEMNKGLAKETHEDSTLKCFTTYVQDLPNGTGKYAL